MHKPAVAAVVVLFHPEVERLEELYKGIHPQVEAVWFIDNTPSSVGGSPSTAEKYPGWDVRYRGLGENQGIARAQNVGIREALAQGSSHVLLLDQDSLLPARTVETLLAAESALLAQGMDVAAVGPVFVDEKTRLPGKAHHHTWFRLHKPFVDLDSQAPVQTDWLIASGSLTRSSVFAKVGLMREELFIDAVDMEWGMRALSMGLKSFVIPTAPIAHSIGDSFVRFLGRSVIVHSEVRNYYIARNWMYLLRLRSMGARWRSGVLPHMAKFLLVHTWISKGRWRRARLFAKAVFNGVRGRMGPVKL